MSYLRPAAALILITAVACSPAPRRPAGVPEDAVWVGSASEGCFLKIGQREFAGWHMEGWDREGKQVVEGIWDLEGIARAAIQPKEIIRFDGQTFHMDDGATITRRE